jgi:hypothetical protein
MDVPPLVWRSNEELRRRIEIIGNFMRGPVARGVCGALRHFWRETESTFSNAFESYVSRKVYASLPVQGRARPAGFPSSAGSFTRVRFQDIIIGV